jgi:putative tryptophan/tyrosine transport system substrate-binding protein
MRRREFIAGLGGAAVWPLAARGEQALKQLIGILSLAYISPNSSNMFAFRRGLAENGFSGEQNISFEFRGAGELRAAGRRDDQLRELVEDLLSRHPAAIVAVAGPGPVLAAKAATSTVPIIFISGLDPINYGFVASFNRPAGNVTGISFMSSELIGKRLNLLLELAPQAKTLGYLSGPTTSPVSKDWTARTIEAAKALGRDIVVQAVRQNIDIENAFTSFVERQVEAITVATDTIFADPRRSKAVVELATRYKMPAVYGEPFFPRIGGLISYSAVIDEMWHQLGTQYIARILKGAKPADLPVQQPTKFELRINLKAAKVLGLMIPPTLLALADEVIGE